MPGNVFESWQDVTGPTVWRVDSVAAAVLPALVSGATGRVHAVVGRALDLELDGGELVGVLARPAGRVPNGVHLAEAVDFRDPALGLAVGDPVAVVDGRLRLRDDLLIDLRWAPPWLPGLAPVAVAPPDCLAANRRRARGRVRLEPALAGPARALARATEALAPARVAAAVGDLVALGGGPHPAGDDLLLGALAALQIGDHPCAPVLGRAVLGALDRTTPRRAALLRLAATGQHAELIGHLAAALLAGDPLDVDAALDRLLAATAGSAHGLAHGALLGLDLVATRRSAAGAGMLGWPAARARGERPVAGTRAAV